MSAYGSIPTKARRVAPGQVSMWVDALDREDATECIARMQDRPWAPRIVGRPTRVGQRWQFVVRRP